SAHGYRKSPSYRSFPRRRRFFRRFYRPAFLPNFSPFFLSPPAAGCLQSICCLFRSGGRKTDTPPLFAASFYAALFAFCLKKLDSGISSAFKAISHRPVKVRIRSDSSADLVKPVLC